MIKKLCTLLLSSKPDTGPYPVTIVNSHGNKYQIIFVWLTHQLPKCRENIDYWYWGLNLIKKNGDGFWFVWQTFNEYIK